MWLSIVLDFWIISVRVCWGELKTIHQWINENSKVSHWVSGLLSFWDAVQLVRSTNRPNLVVVLFLTNQQVWQFRFRTMAIELREIFALSCLKKNSTKSHYMFKRILSWARENLFYVGSISSLLAHERSVNSSFCRKLGKRKTTIYC
jgi:hypothetical protein